MLRFYISASTLDALREEVEMKSAVLNVINDDYMITSETLLAKVMKATRGTLNPHTVQSFINGLYRHDL